MADLSGGATPQDPHAGEDGFYDGYGNWVPNYNSLPTTPPTQTPGSSVGPNLYQGAGGQQVAYPYQPASTQNQIENGNTQGFELSPEQQAQMQAAIAATAARNAAIQSGSSARGTAPSTGEGQNLPPAPAPLDFPGAPTLDAPDPGPPAPADITGTMPDVAPSRGQVFGGGHNGDGMNEADQSFASLIPRVAGNSVSSPSDISGARPNVPAWAKGLSRSPYSRFLARGGQSSFSVPGFADQEVPVDDVEARRLQELAGVPAWAQPVTPGA